MRIKKVSTAPIPSVDGAVVDSLSGSSTTNAPSVRAVNEGLLDTYSTSEIKTNGIWINNKPIYRKVIEKTVNSNTTGTVDLSGLGYDVIWVNQGKSFNQYNTTASSSGVSWANNPSSNSDYGLVYINQSKVMNIKNNSGANRTYYVTIEYTKTTD